MDTKLAGSRLLEQGTIMPKLAPGPKPLNFKGTKGADTITGSALNDKINGKQGDDMITGGGGVDTLTGGIGADTFVYNDPRHGGDLITDFDAAAGDVVDLSEFGTATLMSAYDPNSSDLQAVFSYNAATNITTLTYHNGEAPFSLRFKGDVPYKSDAFLGIVEPPVLIVLGIENVSAHEHDGTMTFTVTRTGNIDEEFTFEYLVITEEASAGHDFLFPPGDETLTFAPGQSSLTITFTVVDDNIYESSFDNPVENFQIHAFSRGTFSEGASAIGQIIDNDAPTGGNDNFTGTYNDDFINLLGGDDTFDGLGGDDFLIGGAGNDTLIGGDGSDTAGYFEGQFADYSVSQLADGAVLVREQNGDVDTLTSIEHLWFSDYQVAVSDLFG